MFLTIALASLALQITGSPIQAAWLVSISALATFIMGLVASWFIDKFPRKHLMLICDILRAFLIIPLFFISDENFWFVYIIVFLIACCNSVFHPSREGYIQSQFEKDDRLEIVSTIQSYLSSISLIGPTIAGILIAFFSPRTSFVINLTAFIISALFIMKITKDTPVSDSRLESFWKKISSGWVYLFRNKSLLKLNISRFFLTSALAIYVIVNYLYLASMGNPTIFNITLTFPIVLGLVNTIQGAGALVGGFVIKKNKKKISNNLEKLFIYSGVIFATGFILWTFENINSIILGSFLIGIGLIVCRTGISLIGQSITDSRYIGRAITVGDAMARLSNITVTSLTSILIIYFSPKLLLSLSAILAIAISINYLERKG